MPPASTSPPEMDKVELIESSMRSFNLGVLGLLPIVGIPFAIISLRSNSRIKRCIGPQWNPAHRHLFWGTVCARMGISLTIILILFVAVAVAFDLMGCSE